MNPQKLKRQKKNQRTSYSVENFRTKPSMQCQHKTIFTLLK